jgi:hypothetical protein
MDEMSWKQRGLVLLSILAIAIIGLAINQGASRRADQVLRA